jgi:cytoskeletal protein CcmA (bactofilin family)
MPLDQTNFHPLGPVKSVDLLQFYNLHTGVMLDQPVTYRNALSVGGNQGLTTTPLKVYGAVGQNTNLIDLYVDRTQAQPGFGLTATGVLAWGPGSTAPQDTYVSRIGTQNGHSSDTAGVLVTPLLEVDGALTVDGTATFKGVITGPGNRLTVPGLDVQGTLTVAGATTLNSTLNVAGAITTGSQISLPGGASLTGTRLTFQGGGSVLIQGTDTIRLLNHATIDYDLTVGRNLQVNGGGAVVGAMSFGSITTGTISNGDWFRLASANTGIFCTPLGNGVVMRAEGPCLYPSNDPLVGINSTQTMTNKTLVDPKETNNVVLGGASFTLPEVGANAGRWRQVKAWGQNMTIYLTNGTFILGTVQYGSGQYILKNGDSVSCYSDGGNWWVL